MRFTSLFFTSPEVYRIEISLRVKSNFGNLQHDSRTTFFILLRHFFSSLSVKMVDHKKRQLTVLLSSLSSILTTVLTLFQLHGVLVMKLMEHRRHLQHLHGEAVVAKNIALCRYRAAKRRFVITKELLLKCLYTTIFTF